MHPLQTQELAVGKGKAKSLWHFLETVGTAGVANLSWMQDVCVVCPGFAATASSAVEWAPKQKMGRGGMKFRVWGTLPTVAAFRFTSHACF